MKTKIIKMVATAAWCITALMVKAQSGNVSITAYVSDQIAGMPQESQAVLQNKLSSIITQNGVTNGPLGSRFILTPNISVMTKDILPGPPPMHAYNLDITFYVGDGIEGRKFASKTVSVKGVGTNETKAYIDAIKNIKPNDANITALLEEGKKKIIDYYNTNCDNIIKSAQAAAGKANYEEAIALLTGVPDACQPCYDKALAAAEPMYKKYLDQQCSVNLTKARAAWNANQNSTGASEAGQLLAVIEPSAACYSEASALNKEISQRMQQLGDNQWAYKMKVQEGNVEIAKAKYEAYSKIGAAYYLSRRNFIIYNIRGWW